MADHDFDMDLIMALAEGRLPPDEAAAAEAALDASARSELEAQRAALAALAGMAAVRLTDAERTALRSSVREAIHLEAAAPPAPASAGRAPWFSRLFPALAGAAVLILVVGIGLNLGGSGDDDSSADLATAETVAATTAAAERAADESASMMQAAEAPAAEGAETTMAATEAAEVAEEAAAADAGSDAVALEPIATPEEFRFQPAGDIQRPDQLIDAMLRYEQDAYVGVLPLEAISPWAERVSAQCWAEALSAVPDAAALRLAGFGEWGDEGAEFYEFVDGDGLVIVAVLRETCELVSIESL